MYKRQNRERWSELAETPNWKLVIEQEEEQERIEKEKRDAEEKVRKDAEEKERREAEHIKEADEKERREAEHIKEADEKASEKIKFENQRLSKVEKLNNVKM